MLKTGMIQMTGRQPNGIALAVFAVFLTASIAVGIGLGLTSQPDWLIALVTLAVAAPGVYCLLALQVAREWEKAVLLRAGKFAGLRGPGLFWIIPVVDTIPVWIDHRVMVTPFNAEKTLTKEATQ